MSVDKVRDSLLLGPWRRRRRMHRLLRELDRADAGRPASNRGSPDIARRAAAVLIGVVIFTVVCGMFAYKEFGIILTAEGLTRKAPLGQPPQVATGVGSFKFSLHQRTDPSRPVTYDPCREIAFEVNDAAAPVGAGAAVAEAVKEVQRATGLVFTDIGTTDRIPAFDETGFGARSEPVLIAWTTPEQLTDLDGSVAGVGGSRAVTDTYTRQLHYVTGTVALDAPQLAEVLTRPDGAEQVRAVVMHELAHLVGLDHVDDPNELMYEENLGRLDFGPGDLEGLAALGSGLCYR